MTSPNKYVTQRLELDHRRRRAAAGLMYVLYISAAISRGFFLGYTCRRGIAAQDSFEEVRTQNYKEKGTKSRVQGIKLSDELQTRLLGGLPTPGNATSEALQQTGFLD